MRRVLRKSEVGTFPELVRATEVAIRYEFTRLQEKETECLESD